MISCNLKLTKDHHVLETCFVLDQRQSSLVYCEGVLFNILMLILTTYVF